jgi:homeobox protein cut-like
MITAQRDRFKLKIQTLEDELSRSNSTVSTLRQEISSLQKDNLQLYEKTRYISSYSRAGGGGGGGGGGGATSSSSSAYATTTTNNSGLGISTNGNNIDRYRQAYESNISPFEAFRGRESARAFHRMGVAERMVYSLARVVLANRTSRNLFAGYCLVLHCLVLCMMYYAGSVEVERHLIVGGVGAGAGAAGAGGGGVGEKDWRVEGFDGN